MYGLELQRRLAARGSTVASIVSHPGYAATNLQSAGVGMDGGSAFFKWLYKLTNAVVAQSATKGAYPQVLVAAWPDAKPGAYYGPTRWGDATCSAVSYDVLSSSTRASTKPSSSISTVTTARCPSLGACWSWAAWR